MTLEVPAKEGFTAFKGYNVWYRIVGDRDEPGKLPLLCLHGGPGVPHDYLEPLEAVAGSGRRVIFYDQLGCGNSDHPHDPSLWTVELFLEELKVICASLELDRFHLLGHSWGGMLAMEYALTKPSGLTSLILASSPASTTQWIAETNRLRSELPAEVEQTLQQHEAAGTTDSPAYQEAMMVLYQRHLCRLEPWPEYLVRSFTSLMQNPEVYHTMAGTSEFKVTGTLKEWDIEGRLGEIKVPTLVTCGRYDESTPAVAATVLAGIKGSKGVIFEQSAHMAHAEEPEKYKQVLEEFLSEVEAKVFSIASL